MDLKFEWDEKKNLLNQIKHGVSFEEATKVFNDPKQREFCDNEHNIFEERWKVIGLVEFDILNVSFTERDGVIRIISARKANKKEEEDYLKWLWYEY